MNEKDDFGKKVGQKAKRKQKARRNSTNGIWPGLGMMGIIGWSIVVPTLIGAISGSWLDKHHPGKYAWTITLMLTGLGIGCLNAWHWLDKEDRNMRDNNDGENNE